MGIVLPTRYLRQGPSIGNLDLSWGPDLACREFSRRRAGCRRASGRIAYSQAAYLRGTEGAASAGPVPLRWSASPNHDAIGLQVILRALSSVGQR